MTGTADAQLMKYGQRFHAILWVVLDLKQKKTFSRTTLLQALERVLLKLPNLHNE